MDKSMTKNVCCRYNLTHQLNFLSLSAKKGSEKKIEFESASPSTWGSQKTARQILVASTRNPYRVPLKYYVCSNNIVVFAFVGASNTLSSINNKYMSPLYNKMLMGKHLGTNWWCCCECDTCWRRAVRHLPYIWIDTNDRNSVRKGGFSQPVWLLKGSCTISVYFVFVGACGGREHCILTNRYKMKYS